MKISARNQRKGKIRKVVHSPVGPVGTLHVAPGPEVVAMIAERSAKALGLAEGMEVCAIIKASNVMIATD